MTSSPNNPANHPSTHMSVFVARLAWMFLGPVGLIIAALLIARLGNGWFTPADALLYVVLGIMLFARWHELASGEGCDGFGNPATTDAFPKFALRSTSLVVACWLVANLIGNVIAPALN